jgi:hypothetical protein
MKTARTLAATLAVGISLYGALPSQLSGQVSAQPSGQAPAPKNTVVVQVMEAQPSVQPPVHVPAESPVQQNAHPQSIPIPNQSPDAHAQTVPNWDLAQEAHAQPIPNWRAVPPVQTDTATVGTLTSSVVTVRPCVIVKQDGKRYQYVEGFRPSFVKLPKELSGRDIRKIVVAGGTVKILGNGYTESDLEAERMACRMSEIAPQARK